MCVNVKHVNMMKNRVKFCKYYKNLSFFFESFFFAYKIFVDESF